MSQSEPTRPNMRQLAPQLSHLDPKIIPTGSPRTLKNQQKPVGFLCFSFPYFFFHLDFLGTLWVPTWSILDAFGGPLGSLGCPVGSSRVFSGLSWAPLGVILGHLGPILGHVGLTLGPSWLLLAPSCSSEAPLVLICFQFWCSRVAFCTFWDPFGTLLGQFWANVGIVFR